MTWDHERAYLGLEAVSAAHERETGTAIAWDRRSLQAFADEPIARLAEAYDLIILDHPHVGQIAETGSLVPLDPLPPEASLGGSAESYEWDGAVWAYPVDAACQVAVRRPDLCPRPPATWDEAVGRGDLRPLTPLLPVDAFDMMMTLVAGMGEEEMAADPRRFVSEANGVRALAILRALYRRGPGEAVRLNPIGALEALATTDEFDCSPCLFGYVNYARPGFRAHALDYVDLPVFEGRPPRGILGGAGIGVSARGRHVEAARAFAARVASAPVQSGSYLDAGGQPAHPAAWEARGGEAEYRGFLHGALPTMRGAWTRPRDPWFLGMVDEVCAIMTGFFERNEDEATFLGRIDAIYQHHRGADRGSQS